MSATISAANASSSSSTAASSSGNNCATFEVRVLKAQIVSGVGNEIIAFFQVCTFDPASPAARTLASCSSPVRKEDDQHALSIRWKRYNEIDDLRKSICNGDGLYSEQQLETTFPPFPSKKWSLTTPPDDRAMLTRRIRKFDAFLRHLSRLMLEYKLTLQVQSKFEKWLAIDVGLGAVEHYQKQGGVRSSQMKGDPILLQWKSAPAAIPQPAPTQYMQPATQPSSYAPQQHTLQQSQQVQQQLSAATSSQALGAQPLQVAGHAQAAPVVPASAQPAMPSTVVRHTAQEIAEAQQRAAQLKKYASLSPADREIQDRAQRLVARLHSFEGWGYQNNATNVLEHWKLDPDMKGGRRRMRSTRGEISKSPFDVSVEIHLSGKFVILKLSDPVKHIRNYVPDGPYYVKVLLPDEMDELLPEQADPRANALLASKSPPKPQRTITMLYSDEEFMTGDNLHALVMERIHGVGHPKNPPKKYFAPNDPRNFCFSREYVEIATPVAISKTGKHDFGD